MQRRLDFAFTLLMAALISICSMGYELLIVRFLTSMTSNAVVSQSLVIGVYLLSLGIGAFLYTKLNVGSKWLLLADVEIGVSLIAVVSLPILSVAFLFLHNTPLFLLVTLFITASIGCLSGLELPALMSAADGLSRRSFGAVLAANYLGALVASLLFPFLLLPMFGVQLTASVLALATAALASLAFLRAFRFRPHLRWIGLALVLAAPPWFASHRDSFEQFYLKSYYYAGPTSLSLTALKETLATHRSLPRVQRFSTPYQDIDIIDDEFELFGGEKSNSFHLYIDQRNQFGSSTEKIYHDTMVHGSINMAGRAPRSVLVIGGGDGLLARELLKYPEIESIKLIELDAKMIDLANSFAPLVDINGRSLKNPKVQVEIADGFAWLRRSHEKFDAVYIDLPHPISVDLSRLYSVEFYKFVRVNLKDDGYMVFDFPFDALMKLSHGDGAYLTSVLTVLKAVDEAGFQSREAFGSWESFLLATPQKRDLSFNYETLGSNFSPLSSFNMAPVILPAVASSIKPNSIFRPSVIKVRNDQGN